MSRCGKIRTDISMLTALLSQTRGTAGRSEQPAYMMTQDQGQVNVQSRADVQLAPEKACVVPGLGCGRMGDAQVLACATLPAPCCPPYAHTIPACCCMSDQLGQSLYQPEPPSASASASLCRARMHELELRRADGGPGEPAEAGGLNSVSPTEKLRN